MKDNSKNSRAVILSAVSLAMVVGISALAYGNLSDSPAPPPAYSPGADFPADNENIPDIDEDSELFLETDEEEDEDEEDETAPDLPVYQPPVTSETSVTTVTSAKSAPVFSVPETTAQTVTRISQVSQTSQATQTQANITVTTPAVTTTTPVVTTTPEPATATAYRPVFEAAPETEYVQWDYWTQIPESVTTPVTATAPPVITTRPPVTTTAPPVSVRRAADFNFTDAAGNVVRLSDFIGQKVIVNIWASWCGPCKSEMPVFQNFYDNYGGEYKVIMLNLTGSDTKADADNFVRGGGYTFPVYYDSYGAADRAYTITAVPTTLFVNADGSLAKKHIGTINEQTLKSTAFSMS